MTYIIVDTGNYFLVFALAMVIALAAITTYLAVRAKVTKTPKE
jgi:hypothetical protein